MKRIVFIILLLLPLSIHAQKEWKDKVNQLDENGLKTGLRIEKTSGLTLDSIKVDRKFIRSIDSAIRKEVEALESCGDDLNIFVSMTREKGDIVVHLEGYTFWTGIGKYYCKYRNIIYFFDDSILQPLFKKTQKRNAWSPRLFMTGEPDILADIVYSLHGKKAQNINNLSQEKVYNVVEKMPSPSQGWNAFNAYLEDNIIDVSQHENYTLGKIVISFIVETNGALTDFCIVKSSAEEANADAISIVSKTSPWIPGQKCELRRRVRMILPLKCMY